MALTKEQILAATDCVIEPIKAPEWGGDVFAKVLSGEERAEYEDEAEKIEGDSAKARIMRLALFLSFSLCDEAGNRLFTKEEAALLAKKRANVVTRVAIDAMSVGGMLVKDVEEKKRD